MRKACRLARLINVPQPIPCDSFFVELTHYRFSVAPPLSAQADGFRQNDSLNDHCASIFWSFILPRSAQIPAPFPASRPRRLRRDAFTRALVREHSLTASDLILPVFVHEGMDLVEPVLSMPGVARLSLDRLLLVAHECVALGIPVLALFPVIDASLKTPDGVEATNPEGLIPRVVRALKAELPQLGILTDVALDPYTSHGQDGLLDDAGYILNDPTVAMLTRQALVQAEAGVDILAPSDTLPLRMTVSLAGPNTKADPLRG